MSTTTPKAAAQPGTGARLVAGLIVIPLLFTLFYNYGITEVIEALGGPDGNINVVAGALATYGLAGIGGLFRHGLL